MAKREYDDTVARAVVNVMQRLSQQADVPSASSDKWLIFYKAELCYYVREVIADKFSESELFPPIVLDEHIVEVWMRVRKNPAQYGLEKAKP